PACYFVCCPAPSSPPIYPLHLSALSSLSSFFSCYGHHPDLHSFPTRRSSDLRQIGTTDADIDDLNAIGIGLLVELIADLAHQPRSEEHTSELQSHLNLVCRLLLEKKKKEEKTIKLLQLQRYDNRVIACISHLD